MNVRRGPVLLLMWAGACGVEPETSTTVSFAIPCPPQYGCSGNASSMPFELHVGSPYLASPTGHRITQVTPPSGYGGPMTLAVPGDATAAPPIPGDELVGNVATAVLTADDLIGTVITITHPDGDWDLRIADTSRFDFLVGGGQVVSYKFEFMPHAGIHKWEPLCPLEVAADDEALPIGGEQHHALVFHGDRYGAVSTKISETAEPWINLACAGTAVAKLHLLRHTAAGRIAGTHETVLRERQAMLRMLRADYCGDGASYTSDGTPLRYADRNGWHPDGIDLAQPSQRKRVEALWDDRGAICLERPRKGQWPACAEPKAACRANLADWTELAHVVSVLP